MISPATPRGPAIKSAAATGKFLVLNPPTTLQQHRQAHPGEQTRQVPAHRWHRGKGLGPRSSSQGHPPPPFRLGAYTQPGEAMHGGTRCRYPDFCKRRAGPQHSPMDTSLMLSWSRNSSATDTFSSFICRKVGRWWYLWCMRFWLSTSSSAISRNPSLRSVCRFPMRLLTHLRCSLHQRVNVFC